jgi:hypothetical protein
MRSHIVEGRKMKSNKAQFIFIVIGIMISVMACASGDQSNPEVEALQDQVNALATQNALLVEKIEDSSSGSTSDEVDAPAPPGGDPDPQVAINTPTPESLPMGPVMAGTPITYDGWAITVNPGILTYGNNWAIEIFIRNLGDTSRVFRYVNAGITATDNLGNTYDITPDLCLKSYHNIKNLNIRGGDSISISPGGVGNACGTNGGIHQFKGPIPLEASQLIIGFDNFGPFTGVEVIIDL